jgi:hypothetical protein
LTANPSGVSGAIQFSNGSAFASDAANLFWDDTNNRLGVGTNAPTSSLHNTGVSRFGSVIIGQAAVTAISSTAQNVAINLSNGSVGIGGFTTFTPSARVHIQGSGSTSATTALLVQNSAGTQLFKITDDGTTSINSGNTGNWNVTNTLYGNNFWITNGGSITAGGQQAAVASAILECISTTKGFLPPRMTTTQINAIASPATGLEVFNTTLNCTCFYNGTGWRQVTHTAM